MTIAVLGGYGVGITMRVPRMPRAGETVAGGVLTREHGGKASNQAIAIARWGSRSALISAVGDDDEGRAARELWSREGVDDSAVITVPDATMSGIILVDSAGENRIAIAAGALDFVWGARNEAPAVLRRGAADTLVVSLEIPATAAIQCVDLARAAGILVLVNPAPADGVPQELWAAADLLVPNQSEARTLLEDIGAPIPPATGLEPSDIDVARALEGHCRGAVVMTCGADGAVIADADGVRRVAAPAVTVVDTTGAGDTFVGVLAAEVTAGTELDVAVERACRAASHSVTHHGVIAGIPFRSEIDGVPV